MIVIFRLLASCQPSCHRISPTPGGYRQFQSRLYHAKVGLYGFALTHFLIRTLCIYSYLHINLSTCHHSSELSISPLKAIVLSMGQINTVISDETETAFRTKIAHMGGKKGDLGKSLEEAIKLWLKKNNKD